MVRARLMLRQQPRAKRSMAGAPTSFRALTSARPDQSSSYPSVLAEIRSHPSGPLSLFAVCGPAPAGERFLSRARPPLLPCRAPRYPRPTVRRMGVPSDCLVTPLQRLRPPGHWVEPSICRRGIPTKAAATAMALRSCPSKSRGTSPEYSGQVS